MKFLLTALAALMFLAMGARAQTTAFTYQGQLNSNSIPVTGSYDLRFQIYNAANSIVAGPLTNAPVGATNGVFVTTLNFGAGVFNGSSLTLEIGVRTNGDTNAYVVLSPRQAITSVPYAIQAINASNAMFLTEPLPVTSLTGIIPNSLLSSNVAVLTNNVVFAANVTATNFTGGFTGNGFGLTNVPATNLVGTVPDARLSTNVAMLNANGVLPDARLSANVALQSNPNLNFAGNVAATNFSGGGHGLTNVPGAFFWVTVSGTNVQAQPNVGYICTNNVNPVTVTLPPSPSIGDTFRVAGVGGAGWIVAQTNNQSILAGNLADGIGVNWTAQDSSRAWSAVDSSADGTKLVAVVKGGLIYTSTNSGATWTPRASSFGNLNWSAVASSADGTKLVATVGDRISATGNIYTSIDSGVTWSLQSGSGARQWVSVACSADGTKLIAAAYGTVNSPGLYTSANSGTNWTFQASAQYSSAVACSADGTKLAAAVFSGTSQGIYTSTNSGVNWLQRTNTGSWTATASSADGNRLIAGINNGSGGQVYVSTDTGATWNPVRLRCC